MLRGPAPIEETELEEAFAYTYILLIFILNIISKLNIFTYYLVRNDFRYGKRKC